MFIKIYSWVKNCVSKITSFFWKSADPKIENERSYKRNINQLKKLIQTANNEVEAKECVQHPIFLTPTENNSLHIKKIERVCDFLISYDAKPFYKRWWAHAQNSGLQSYIKYQRTWLAKELCQPYLNCQSLGDSTFSISKKYFRVFPSKLKSAISNLLINVEKWQLQNSSPVTSKLPRPQTHNNSIDPSSSLPKKTDSEKKDPLIPTISKTSSSQTLIISHLDECLAKDKLSKDKSTKLVCACGFLDLDYKTATTRDILKKLRKLYLRIHPDKMPTDFVNNAGIREKYCARALQSLGFGMTFIFTITNDYFNDLVANDEIIDVSGLSSGEITKNYGEGVKAKNAFEELFQEVMTDIPERHMDRYRLQQTRQTELLQKGVSIPVMHPEQLAEAWNIALQESNIANSTIPSARMSILNQKFQPRSALINHHFDSASSRLVTQWQAMPKHIEDENAASLMQAFNAITFGNTVPIYTAGNASIYAKLFHRSKMELTTSITLPISRQPTLL